MQAIRTYYLGPANTRGSRVKATCQAKSKILDWDDSLNSSENHLAAAKALANELGWNYGKWIGGELPDTSVAWVCKAKHGVDTFTLPKV